MYSTATIVLVLAAAAAPALAYPASGSADVFARSSGDLDSVNTLPGIRPIGPITFKPFPRPLPVSFKRELADDLLSRKLSREDIAELLARADVDESGAFGLTDIIRFVPDIVNGVTSLFNNKRDLEELLARAEASDESGALFGGLVRFLPDIISAASSLFNNKRDLSAENMAVMKRDLEDIFARAEVTDESGALFGGLVRFLPDIIQGVTSIFNNKRDLEELLARADEESGAFGLTDLLKFAPDIINGITSIFGGANNNKREISAEQLSVMKRDLEDLLARADATDESGALLGGLIKFLPDILSGVTSLFNNKRDLEDLLARAEVTDESGALLGGLIKFLPDIISGVTSLFNNKRDLESLLARAEDESGAFGFTNILKFAPDIINGITTLLGGNNNKRELSPALLEFLAAKAPLRVGARSLDSDAKVKLIAAVLAAKGVQGRSLNELD